MRQFAVVFALLAIVALTVSAASADSMSWGPVQNIDLTNASNMGAGGIPTTTLDSNGTSVFGGYAYQDNTYGVYNSNVAGTQFNEMTKGAGGTQSTTSNGVTVTFANAGGVNGNYWFQEADGVVTSAKHGNSDDNWFAYTRALNGESFASNGATGGSTGMPTSVAVTGLTIGQAYDAQFFVAATPSGSATTETISEGGYTSGLLSYGGSTASGAASTVVGTFTALATSETFVLTGANSSWSAVNAFQLRAVTASPEPSTVALLVTGLVGMLCYAWRKRK